MIYFDPEKYYNTQPKEDPVEEDPDLAYDCHLEEHGAFNSEEV